MRKLFVVALLAIACCVPGLSEKLPPPSDVYFNILAGGGGTRLWPLSRDHLPKQFLEVGEKNLIEDSIARLKTYPDFDNTGIVLATAENLQTPMKQLVDRLALKNQISIIADPSRRDTGPAILLNVLKVLEKNPQAVIVFMPADPYIPLEQYPEYVDSLKTAIAYVKKHPEQITLLGKTPTFPATGFGYIETGSNKEGTILSVASFKEKPNEQLAQEFLAKKTYLWNMGIFVGKAQFFADLFKKHAPDIYGPVSNYVRSGTVADYTLARSTSVDIAIMQPASAEGSLAVVPVHFDWEDVGDVETYLKIHNHYLAGVGKSPLVYEHKPDASDNRVFTQTGKLVAFVGVKGLCVVDTADALLIIPCDQSQKVKNVVENLKKDQTLDRYVK